MIFLKIKIFAIAAISDAEIAQWWKFRQESNDETLLNSDDVVLSHRVLSTVVLATEISNADLQQWVQSRVGILDSVFPVVYRKNNKFEVLPHLEMSRRNDVWGYEIMPIFLFQKKCNMQ